VPPFPDPLLLISQKKALSTRFASTWPSAARAMKTCTGSDGSTDECTKVSANCQLIRSLGELGGVASGTPRRYRRKAYSSDHIRVVRHRRFIHGLSRRSEVSNDLSRPSVEGRAVLARGDHHQVIDQSEPVPAARISKDTEGRPEAHIPGSLVIGAVAVPSYLGVGAWQGDHIAR
jgi:hypothetical protein